MQAPKKPAPIQVAAPPKPIKSPPPPKKPVIQKVEKSKISKALATKLQESIAKIDQKSDKEWSKAALSIPGFIHQLKIDLGSEGGQYEGELVGKLQQALDLPEIGEVEIKLTLSCDGRFAQMEVMRSESHLNCAYLKQNLRLIHFSPFTGALIGEKKHTFTLTFCNR